MGVSWLLKRSMKILIRIPSKLIDKDSNANNRRNSKPRRKTIKCERNTARLIGSSSPADISGYCRKQGACTRPKMLTKGD